MSDKKTVPEEHVDPLTLKKLSSDERVNGPQDGGPGIPSVPMRTQGFVKLDLSIKTPRTDGQGNSLGDKTQGSGCCSPQDGICGCGNCSSPSRYNLGPQHKEVPPRPGPQDGGYVGHEEARRAAQSLQDGYSRNC